MSGWIKIHRQMTEWEWYTDVSVFKLFMHLILKANYEDSDWRGVVVKRGEVVTGRHELAAKTGLSEQQIRTALKKLESTSEITIKTFSKFSIITILNYKDYQSGEDSPNQQSNQRINQQSTTSKEEKEIKKYIHTYTRETISLADISDWLKEKNFAFDYEAEIEAFKIHYRKTGGKMNNGKPVSDWRAALQNWFNNAQKFNKGQSYAKNTVSDPANSKPSGSGYGGKPTKHEVLNAGYEQALADIASGKL